MSGYLEDLSARQEETLQQFKSALSDVLEPHHDDRLLLQFLRARLFDSKKAEDMFRKYLQWRKIYPQEYLGREYQPPEVIREYLKAPFLGFDKEGHPIRFVTAGNYDLKGLVNACGANKLTEYVVSIFERDRVRMKELGLKLGRVIETRILIFDLADFKLKTLLHKPVFDFLVNLMRMYEANYPENLKTAYVINIPYFFAWIFNIVKSIASEQTVSKIKIFGATGWKEELLKDIDPEVLPACYGGTRTDPDGDPKCPSLFTQPGPVPDRYLPKNQPKLSVADEKVRQLVLRRRDRKDLPLYTDEPGCTIAWEVECGHQEVNVGLFYKGKRRNSSNEEEENCLEEVVPFERVGGNFGPGCGNHINKKPGMYVLVLDNSFSIFRSKNVLYKIDILPPVSTLIGEDNHADTILAA